MIPLFVTPLCCGILASPLCLRLIYRFDPDDQRSWRVLVLFVTSFGPRETYSMHVLWFKYIYIYIYIYYLKI